jgi:hypothetical protein
MCADKGPQDFWDGEGEQEVRPGELFGQVVLEPRLGLMLLALGTVAVATGMIDTVVCPAALALLEAMAIMAALALLDGTDDFAVCSGKVGVALQVCWRASGENLAQGGHGSSPGMRALRRS